MTDVKQRPATSGIFCRHSAFGGRPPDRWSNARNRNPINVDENERLLAGARRLRAAALAGAAIQKDLSRSILSAQVGENIAPLVIEVRPVERPDRLFAVITFELEWDPPFSVADVVLLDAERLGTDTNRGRTRIGQLIRIARRRSEIDLLAGRSATPCRIPCPGCDPGARTRRHPSAGDNVNIAPSRGAVMGAANHRLRSPPRGTSSQS